MQLSWKNNLEILFLKKANLWTRDPSKNYLFTANREKLTFRYNYKSPEKFENAALFLRLGLPSH